MIPRVVFTAIMLLSLAYFMPFLILDRAMMRKHLARTRAAIDRAMEPAGKVT